MFSVHDHLHEHLCTFNQFCIVSSFFFATLIYFFFVIKRETLVGKTLLEIESTVAKQTKIVRFCFFQNILPVRAFYHRHRDI